MAFVYMFTKLWIYSKENKWKIVLYYILHILSNIAILLQPIIIAKVFDAIQLKSVETIKSVIYWLTLYVVCFFIFNILHRTARFIEEITSFNCKRNYSISLYEKVCRNPMSWHSDNHSGETINKINMSSDAIGSFGQRQYIYIEHVMMFIGPLFAIFILSPKLMILSLIIAVLTLVLINRFDVELVPLYRKENNLINHFSAGIYDFVSNMRTLITLKLTRQSSIELQNRYSSIYPNLIRTEIINQVKWFLVSFSVLLLEVGILLVYITENWTKYKLVHVGITIALFQYLRQLSGTFVNISSSYSNILRWKTNCKSASSIEKTMHAPDQHNEDFSWREIKIKNTAFSYKDTKAINNVSIELFNKRKIAFVGASGSGKSTMLGIMRGLNKVDTGDLFIDGEKKDFNILSNVTTLIPQDPELFENNVEFNISLGLFSDQEKLKESISLAQFDSILARLPNALKTDVREKGVNLSGGEKQRLALARGLYAINESSIILLDEPTSSVDAINEIQFFTSLMKKYADKCIVVSIHSLNVLPLFDYIYVFKNGEIIQEGTFDALSSKDGYFSSYLNQYSLFFKEQDNQSSYE